MELEIDELKIKADSVEARPNNLADRFWRTFAKKQPGSNVKVYNLTINGNGRFYFAPSLKVIAVYILGEFLRQEKLERHIPTLNQHLT